MLPHPLTAKQSLRLRATAELERRRRLGQSSPWPDTYTNSVTGNEYQPHNDEEAAFVFNDSPRYALLKGGEGGGKSVAGIIKTLTRLRRGENGIMVSPDLEHFKKSLWPEFRRWCPWRAVIDRHRYRQEEGWEASRTFMLTFQNDVGGYSTLACGGAKETEISTWRGPNVSFLHFDEASRHRTAAALKLFDGRVRIPGPSGQPGQLYFTTTPEKHWLYDYFGPAQDNDPFLDFKRDSFVATVLTVENAANLEPGFVEKRAQSLTAAEIRVLLKAEWETISDISKFVNIIWWDNCQQGMLPLTKHMPLVIAMDANKGSENVGYVSDCFAMVAVSKNDTTVEVRYCGIWQPQSGQLMDYKPIKDELVRLCQEFAVIEVAYDPTELHYFVSQLAGLANFKEFNQQGARLIADKELQDLIMARNVAHDGNPLLRQHIDNSDVKKHSKDEIRLVKRNPSNKIDGAVALSMASSRIRYYNL